MVSQQSADQKLEISSLGIMQTMASRSKEELFCHVSWNISYHHLSLSVE